MKYQITKIDRDWTVIILMWLTIIAAGFAVSTIYSSYMQEGKTNRTVKSVCDYARGHDDGESEEACGIAQDQSSTEYVCDSRNIDAHCWVERK